MSSGEGLAQISIALAGLFPAGVVCAELLGAGNPDSLLPEEAQFLGRSVAVRRQEFAAGRACARRALRELGIVDFALKVAADRRPVWPPSIVGSITHTAGFCAAVVAQRGAHCALGIDTELAGRVKSELWARICAPEERLLESMPMARRAAAATLIFCIKEAFYKCQYTLTEEYLGFGDVRVELANWPKTAGGFAIHACRPIALMRHTAMPLRGRYLFHEEFVTAGIALPQ